MDNKAIGCYLLNKRKELGKTQKDIADLFNVTYQAVSRWENGESIPDIITLVAIADFYDVSVDEILQREVKHVQVVNKEEFDPAQMIWVIALMSGLVYAFAYGVFYLLEEIVVKDSVIAIIGFSVFGLAGLVPINAYYISEKYYDGYVRTKMDKIAYFVSYVPLLICIILVIFQILSN